MFKKMYATVKGTTCDNEPFEEDLVFTMIPPEDNNHYGTGYYMLVKMSISGAKLCDVRYDRTTDVEILADRFIKNWYGPNAHEITKQFPQPELVPMPGAEKLADLKKQYS